MKIPNEDEINISSHYFITDQLNYIYCLACLEIILDKSKKAKVIFEEINKCWELPGCKDLLDEVGRSVRNVEFYKMVITLMGLSHNEDNTMKLSHSKGVIPAIRKLIERIILRKKSYYFFKDENGII